MDRIVLKVNAKINLSLDVLGIRQDGYHKLDMCVASCDVADTLDCTLAKDITIIMDGQLCFAENIAYRAVEKCVSAGIIDGLCVNITKGIPFSSGMGGSSADCAGVLVAVQKLTGCNHTPLLEIAKSLASDAVFMYYGGLARATGKGDDLEFLTYKKLHLLIAKNKGSALTKEVFKQFDSIKSQPSNYTQKCIESLINGTIALGNGLTSAACIVDENITKTLQTLAKVGKNVCMTGSGSACFAVFDSLSEAESAMAVVKDALDFVTVATTRPSGIEIISF